jgi:hypothetical protein
MAERESVRAELEATRAKYHALLDSLTDADLKKRSGNPAWTVGQLMWHLAAGTGFTAGGIENARKGKGFNPPQFLANPINVWSTRLGARRATRHSLADRYDAGHARLLAVLDTVREDEWQKGARFFGQYQTVEALFRSVAQHFDEHEIDIKKGLGRG